MAIHIPRGSHEDAPQPEVTFVDLMGERKDLLKPPDPGREAGRIRITAAFALLNAAIVDYQQSLERDGVSEPSVRTRLNVRNTCRAFHAVAAILMQNKPDGDDV